MIKSVYDGNFTGKKTLVRVDFNVPFENGKISDATRISSALPTLDKIIDDGGIPVLMSHLGRPDGKVNPKYSLKPVADYLADTYGYEVVFAENCIGEPAETAVNNADNGQIVLLENLRFHAEEEANDSGFAAALAKLGDCYVNDAFGSAHRAHASVDRLAKSFDERYAGALMINEVDYLGKSLDKPIRPFVAVIGGAKISGKIDVINNLFDKCDTIIIGGGMTFTFYKAMGLNIGSSLLEAEKVELAKETLEKAKEKGVNILLPVDIIVADGFKEHTQAYAVKYDEMPDNMIGMDIGPDSIELFSNAIVSAKTIVWNGPMGVFEQPKFAAGTLAIAKSLARATELGGITIVGGGDSASAINQMGYDKKVSHVSTGGGASLEYLEGKVLPGVAALEV